MNGRGEIFRRGSRPEFELPRKQRAQHARAQCYASSSLPATNNEQRQTDLHDRPSHRKEQRQERRARRARSRKRQPKQVHAVFGDRSDTSSSAQANGNRAQAQRLLCPRATRRGRYQPAAQRAPDARARPASTYCAADGFVRTLKRAAGQRFCRANRHDLEQLVSTPVERRFDLVELCRRELAGRDQRIERRQRLVHLLSGREIAIQALVDQHVRDVSQQIEAMGVLDPPGRRLPPWGRSHHCVHIAAFDAYLSACCLRRRRRCTDRDRFRGRTARTPETPTTRPPRRTRHRDLLCSRSLLMVKPRTAS